MPDYADADLLAREAELKRLNDELDADLLLDDGRTLHDDALLSGRASSTAVPAGGRSAASSAVGAPSVDAASGVRRGTSSGGVSRGGGGSTPAAAEGAGTIAGATGITPPPSPGRYVRSLPN